jgi:hypothetical protein
MNVGSKVLHILNSKLSSFFSCGIVLFVSPYLMSHLNKTLNIGSLLIMLRYVNVASDPQLK